MKRLLFILLLLASPAAAGTNWAPVGIDLDTGKIDFSQSGTVSSTNEWLILEKLDIGLPGTFKGLDIGEGGSYGNNTGANKGTNIVQFWTLDDTNSTFTHEGDRAFTQLTNIGDRVIIGTASMAWASRWDVDVAKSSGFDVVAEYYSSTGWVEMPFMVTLKDDGSHQNEQVWQATNTHYVSFEDGIDDNMHLTNNVSGTIPDNGKSAAWYWYSFRNISNITTAAQLSDCRVRGTDHDFTSFGKYVRWGEARTRRELVYAQGIDFVLSGANLPANQDFYVSSGLMIEGLDNSFSGNALDQLKFSGEEHPSIDTSGKMIVTVQWAPNGAISAGETVEWVVDISFETTNITFSAPGPPAADELVLTNRVVVSDYSEGQIINTDFHFDIKQHGPGSKFFGKISRNAVGGNTNDTYGGAAVFTEMIISTLDWTE